MALQSLAPILATADLDRAVRFYVGVLGFTCGLRTESYANLTRDRVRIMLAAPNAHEPWSGPRFTGQLSIGLASAADVDALWASVRDKAEAVYAVADFDYGQREFAIRDPDGYQLSFGAPSAKR